MYNILIVFLNDPYRVISRGKCTGFNIFNVRSCIFRGRGQDAHTTFPHPAFASGHGAKVYRDMIVKFCRKLFSPVSKYTLQNAI